MTFRTPEIRIHKNVINQILKATRIEYKGTTDIKRLGVKCADKLEPILIKYCVIKRDKDIENKNMVDYRYMYNKLMSDYCDRKQ